MTPGRREVEPLLQTGNISVMYIDGEKPRTSRKNLAEILGELAGTVRVCDPWYGVRSLESLEMIRAENEVRFLTARTNENLARLTGPLKDFKTERPRTELRRVQNAGELHDRYVLGEQLLLIVGHGLKDIGGKQSFIITVPKALAPDLIAQVRTAFDEKWKTAVPL
jgi:hypothetical protein